MKDVEEFRKALRSLSIVELNSLRKSMGESLIALDQVQRELPGAMGPVVVIRTHVTEMLEEVNREVNDRWGA